MFIQRKTAVIVTTYHVIYTSNYTAYTMTRSMKNLTECKEWQALVSHQQEIASHQMQDWFAEDDTRVSRFSLQAGGLFLDYSRNRINDKTLSLLLNLAQSVDLKGKINSLFDGTPINVSENRSALHTALRDKTHASVLVNGKNVAPLIHDTLEKMRHIVEQIHSGEWTGATGKPIKHIINFGIGGSYLGPLMCTQALKDYAVSNLQFHFVSTGDQTHLQDVLQQVDPESSLCIISSKSFTTLETFTNANIIMNWMKERIGDDALTKHFIAITAASEKAVAFGIPSNHILPLWEWVGGRYSIWSAIGLPLMLMIGYSHFSDFLEGAYEMDQHFYHADFSHNMPVLLALIGIWYINFFGVSAHAIVPYAYRLRKLIAYLQQADMESNGKSVNLLGDPIHYSTGPIIFGEEGCNGQHAYHQLLHQGKHLIPVDFILIGKSHCDHGNHQAILLASGLSQAQALMYGKQDPNVPHRAIPGNRPSNTLYLDQLSPKHLGALIALYEHKIFVQGAIWNINSFDQWGVELGKQLLPDILHCIQNNNTHPDPATAAIIKRFREDK